MSGQSLVLMPHHCMIPKTAGAAHSCLVPHCLLRTTPCLLQVRDADRNCVHSEAGVDSESEPFPEELFCSAWCVDFFPWTPSRAVLGVFVPDTEFMKCGISPLLVMHLSSLHPTGGLDHSPFGAVT